MLDTLKKNMKHHIFGYFSLSNFIIVEVQILIICQNFFLEPRDAEMLFNLFIWHYKVFPSRINSKPRDKFHSVDFFDA